MYFKDLKTKKMDFYNLKKKLNNTFTQKPTELNRL